MLSLRCIAPAVVAGALALTLTAGAAPATETAVADQSHHTSTSHASTSGADSRHRHGNGTQDAPLDILLTNDDGWLGEGGAETPWIVALRDALEAEGHNVVVVAPGTGQSGQGGRLSFSSVELALENPEPGVWTLTPGSPADTVQFALDEIYGDDTPDLVISGMNPGGNIGQAVSHSGTFNAASTALEYGVPSIAVSMVDDEDEWEDGANVAAPGVAEYVTDLVDRVQQQSWSDRLMPAGLGLNVNVPVRPGPIDPQTGEPGDALAPRGEKLTTLDTSPWAEFDYTNITGDPGTPGTYSIAYSTLDSGEWGTDTWAVGKGYVSITPFESDRDLDHRSLSWVRSLF